MMEPSWWYLLKFLAARESPLSKKVVVAFGLLLPQQQADRRLNFKS
jgi:hypothetical protein